MSDTAVIAEFIRTKGITKCPTAACVPTQASPDAASRAELQEHYKKHPELLFANPKERKRTAAKQGRPLTGEPRGAAVLSSEQRSERADPLSQGRAGSVVPKVGLTEHKGGQMSSRVSASAPYLVQYRGEGGAWKTVATLTDAASAQDTAALPGLRVIDTMTNAPVPWRAPARALAPRVR